MFENTTYGNSKYQTKRHNPPTDDVTETTHLYCNATRYESTVGTQRD